MQRHATEPIYARDREPVGDHIPMGNVGEQEFNQRHAGHVPMGNSDQDFDQRLAVVAHKHAAEAHTPAAPRDAAAVQGRPEEENGLPLDESHHEQAPGTLYREAKDMRPGQGLYKPPEWMDEWEKGTTGTLSGALLDLSFEQPPAAGDKSKAWWEVAGGRGERSGSFTSRQRKAEAFDGEYDDTNDEFRRACPRFPAADGSWPAPTRFKPPLYLKCGPLLRYCGIRRETFPTRPQREGAMSEREMWRGSIMIVTQDSESSYEIAPMLRLFVQDVGLLPPPPPDQRRAGGRVRRPDCWPPQAGPTGRDAVFAARGTPG